MIKIFCCPALELFHYLPLWKTVLFVSSRAFLLSTPTFSLSTPVDSSEATWKKLQNAKKDLYIYIEFYLNLSHKIIVSGGRGTNYLKMKVYRNQCFRNVTENFTRYTHIHIKISLFFVS
jgi:hypothetical protein